MKSKYIVYPVVLLLFIGTPTIRYYSSTPWVNACVLDYVDNLEQSGYKGYMYDIDGVKHIEPQNSDMTESIKQYEIGRSVGCLMISNNLFNDLNNTLYCTMTFLIKRAPVGDRLKEPLWILKTE